MKDKNTENAIPYDSSPLVFVSSVSPQFCTASRGQINFGRNCLRFWYFTSVASKKKKKQKETEILA